MKKRKKSKLPQIQWSNSKKTKKRLTKAQIKKRKIRLALISGVLVLFSLIMGIDMLSIRTLDISPLGLPGNITNQMVVSSIKARDKYDVPASVTIAQMIQESTGKYGKGLSELAYNYHNLFGVKGKGPRGSVSLETFEYDENGNRYTTYADFRVYRNFRQSIMDHGKLLSSEMYQNVTAGIDWETNLEGWVYAMSSIYATDPGYGDSLMRLIYTYDLQRFDTISIHELKGLAE